MPCGCKNKQNAAATQKPAVAPRPSSPSNNGVVSSRRVEKRIIR